MKQMTFCQFLLLPALLLLMLAGPVAAEDGQIYTIKKGDTLWGLSQRFIDDPYYWPNLWADNPDITNPHLIFPGQKIRILDGRLEIIPAYPEPTEVAGEEPPAVEQTLEPAVAEAVVQVKSAHGSEGFIRTSESPLGMVVDSVDNRVLLTKNDLVFLKMTPEFTATVGDTYSLYMEGVEVMHPQTELPVGTMMNNLGFLQVTEIKNETVTAKIGDIYREVERGAKLFEYIPPRDQITLKQGSTELKGYVVASRDEKMALGAHDVIFIDLGGEDGLETGNLFYVSRPRHASSEIIGEDEVFTLPDEVLGAAVVIEVHAQTAAALILKSVDAIFIGDQVSLATN